MENLKEERREKQLVALISQCQEMIYEKDVPNTLVQQLSDIALYDSIYRCFNEGLRLDKGNENRPKIIIDLFHRFFFVYQTIGIRKIFDQDKNAYSLRRIFDLIHTNWRLFTRKGYLTAHADKIEDARKRGMAEHLIEGLQGYYDLISATAVPNRSDNDTLYFPYLEMMNQYLNKKNLIHEFTNTYIAHPSNKQRQALIKDELRKVSLRRMQELYKDISWLSYTLSYYIGDIILFEVPSYPYDQFEGWIGSLYKKNIRRALKSYWDKRFMMFENMKRKYWFSNVLYVTPRKIGKLVSCNIQKA